MDNNIIVGVLAFTCCICIFLAWFFTHKARHRERLLMIEKGMNPDENADKVFSIRKAVFKLGVVVVGLGVGLGIIGILVQLNALGRSGAIPISILAICGGGALALSNRLTNPKN